MFITRLPEVNDPAYVVVTNLVQMEIVSEKLTDPVLANLETYKIEIDYLIFHNVHN